MARAKKKPAKKKPAAKKAKPKAKAAKRNAKKKAAAKKPAPKKAAPKKAAPKKAAPKAKPAAETNGADMDMEMDTGSEPAEMPAAEHVAEAHDAAEEMPGDDVEHHDDDM